MKKQNIFLEMKKSDIINQLQNETHQFLNSFLNGSLLTSKSRYLYPWVKEYQPEKVHRFLENIESILNGLHHTGSRELKDGYYKIENYKNVRKFDVRRISGLISSLYKILNILVEADKSEKEKIVVKCPNAFESNRYKGNDKKYLSPILALNKYISANLKRFLHGAYLHGSLATMDYVKGNSDLDILLILNKAVVLNKKELAELEKQILPGLKYFYQIDPLQHHGFIVITQIDMKCYPQSYFPFILFDYAVKLLGPAELVFNERSSALERKNMLKNMLIKKDRQRLSQSLRDFFSLKYFLSIIQLIPTIFLQSRGEYCYKRDSFKKLRSQYEDVNWSILDKATLVRSNWKNNDSKLLQAIARFSPNPFFIPLVYQKFHKHIPANIQNILGINYLDEYYEFCNSLTKKALLS